MGHLPTEIRIGPFIFEWDESSHKMYINRPEEHVGTVEHVWKDTWQHFVDAAHPYQGPG